MITTTDCVNNLRSQIWESLSPLITDDYVFIELPYYPNPGDALIWSGTENFLKNFNYKCLCKGSFGTFQFPKLDERTIIILQGGGNFGDLYRLNQDFRNKVYTSYPNNKIIVLPQSVYYQGRRALIKDVKIMRNHKHLTICARDRYSYNFLRKFRFSDKVMLVPDMAFYNDIDELNKYALPTEDKELIVRRIDAEARNLPSNVLYESNIQDVSDWAIVEKENSIAQKFRMLQNESSNHVILDDYALNIFLPNLIETGIKQISQYKKIYATRLHAAILSIILGKDVEIWNNSYGKNKNFYETWLTDLDGVTFRDSKTIYSVKEIKRKLKIISAYISLLFFR